MTESSYVEDKTQCHYPERGDDEGGGGGGGVGVGRMRGEAKKGQEKEKAGRREAEERRR